MKDFPQIEICDYFSIGPLTEEPLVVSVGKVSHVWRLETKQGCFALKAMPSGRFSAETEKIAQSFKQAQLPVVTADSKGAYYHHDYCFSLFEWIEGITLTPNEITESHAALIGELLARLHQCHLDPAQFDLSTLNDFFYDGQVTQSEWTSCIDRAYAANIAYKEKLQALLPTLIEFSEKSRLAKAQLKPFRLISHRDLSPYNVIWKPDGKPAIIDWELAGLIHPHIELIGLAFDWSVITPRHIDADRYQAVMQAYQQAIGIVGEGSFGIVGEGSLAFIGAMGTWVNWLFFNLARFIEEKSPWAEQQVINTLLTFEQVIQYHTNER